MEHASETGDGHAGAPSAAGRAVAGFGTMRAALAAPRAAATPGGTGMRSLAAIGLVLAAAPCLGDERPIFPYPVRQSTLDNGLAVISIPYDSPGVVAYYTLVRTGSRNEVETGLSGFAHFFEHMMFRGTPRYSEEAYNDALRALGANFNASTSDDGTRYYLTIPAPSLEKVMELEADRFQNLRYDEPSFQKEARAVLGEYNKSASSPFLLLNETMQDLAYTTHTYKHTTIGFLADIKDMPNQYAYSKVFFDRWYRPENCTLIVAGDVDHDRLVELARKYYGGWKRGEAPTVAIPAEPEQTAERTKALTWPTPTLPVVYLAWHIPSGDPKNPDVAALGALAQAVFGETSPLYQELVLKEQKVARLMADAEPRRDPGLFGVIALVRDVRDMDEVRHRIQVALEEAAEVPVEPGELAEIKSHLRYDFAGALDSADAVARTVGAAIAVSGRPEAINELFAAYERLTPQDLQRVAGRYFKPENRNVVTLRSEATR
jgi:zinc protease